MNGRVVLPPALPASRQGLAITIDMILTEVIEASAMGLEDLLTTVYVGQLADTWDR